MSSISSVLESAASTVLGGAATTATSPPRTGAASGTSSLTSLVQTILFTDGKTIAVQGSITAVASSGQTLILANGTTSTYTRDAGGSATATPTPSSSSGKSGISGGAGAGIAVGIVIFFACLVAAFWIFWLRPRRRRRQANEPATVESQPDADEDQPQGQESKVIEKAELPSPLAFIKRVKSKRKNSGFAEMPAEGPPLEMEGNNAVFEMEGSLAPVVEADSRPVNGDIKKVDVPDTVQEDGIAETRREEGTEGGQEVWKDEKQALKERDERENRANQG